MNLNRRELLARAGLLAAATQKLSPAAESSNVSGLLTKADFPIAETQTYLLSYRRRCTRRARAFVISCECVRNRSADLYPAVGQQPGRR